MNINCIIIDDDPVVISYLRGYITQIPFLNLSGAYQAPLAGLAALETLDVQLIFMDIGMPGINGMELAKMLNSRHGDAAPRIIFISGFDRFALDSYQVNALDYLVKPVTHEDFFKSAYKAQHYFEHAHKAETEHTTYGLNDFIFLRVEHELVRVYLKDILYVESFKDYLKVYTAPDGKMYKALATMKCAEEKLPAHSFMRVHRSFMVSLDKIDAIYNHTIKIGKTTIPVTEQYRAQFKEFVQRCF